MAYLAPDIFMPISRPLDENSDGVCPMSGMMVMKMLCARVSDSSAIW